MNESEGVVDWNSIGTMVAAIQGPDGTQWYLLEETDSLQVTLALRDNTVALTSSSRTTQTFGGTEMRVLAFDKRGGQLHRFLADFQYVEGMGDDKNSPTPSIDLLLQQGQSERCSLVLGLVEGRGKPISMTQFERYAKQFQDVGYVFLYWRN